MLSILRVLELGCVPKGWYKLLYVRSNFVPKGPVTSLEIKCWVRTPSGMKALLREAVHHLHLIFVVCSLTTLFFLATSCGNWRAPSTKWLKYLTGGHEDYGNEEACTIRGHVCISPFIGVRFGGTRVAKSSYHLVYIGDLFTISKEKW